MKSVHVIGEAAPLSFRDLRLVAAVANEGTLERASLALHLTPSALSHRLKGLEARLGCLIFERSWRRMHLTSAGESLLRTAHRVLSLVADAEDAAQKARGETPVLRLSTECYTCYGWLPTVVRAYRRTQPSVAVHIVASATGHPLAELLAGHLDLAIVTRKIRDRRLAFRSLFRDELVALVPAGHPWARRPCVRAVDFAAEHLLHYPFPRSELLIFRAVLSPAGVEPRRCSQIQFTEAILAMVREGLGVAVLARWAATEELATGALRAVRVEGGLQREWRAACLRSTASADHVADFIEDLREYGPGPNRGSASTNGGADPAAGLQVAKH